MVCDYIVSEFLYKVCVSLYQVLNSVVIQDSTH